ncbi:PREDICTED: uncharacterized protein LOC109160887 [Ipomoea nil]|uniref:uncharacterized protein LOC109160887 n=1 Tax=Ipomoea nil TaxID=35883 RepID=UPI000900A220|nr:PREDICTED: uncharacterized protein LOC109160887 [Ipomoea nil]
MPAGPIPIVERDSQLVSPELRAWRDEVNQRRGRVTVKALCERMQQLEDGGMWFKLHFSIVVVTTLVASTPNGYANQKIVHMLSNVDRIKDLDWCGYLIQSLVSTHRSWTEDSSRKFIGPLLFLSLLYLDRVAVGMREVPRTVPLVAVWTTDFIKAREWSELTSGGFGQGQLDAPLRASGNNMGFATEFAVAAGELRSWVARVVGLISQHPSTAREDCTFQIVVESNKLLDGVVNTSVNATVLASSPPAPSGGRNEETMWNDEEFIRELDQAVLVATGTGGMSDLPTGRGVNNGARTNIAAPSRQVGYVCGTKIPLNPYQQLGLLNV